MNRPSPKSEFNAVARQPTKKPKRKSPPPFSLRLSWDERAQLEREAGRLSLGEHIRRKLFGKTETKGGTRQRSHTKPHNPTIDHVALAQLLGTLGQSELGRSMIALSMAAQCGALPVDDELTDKLHSACDDISEMRNVLIVALGIKPQSGDRP